MKPACSILMAVYNSEKYIAIAITSLLSQSIKNWELIIVDDGSTDFSPLIAASFNDSRIKVFKRVINRGKANAMQYGLKHCQGRYLLELDADDWLDVNCLETLLKAINNQSDEVGMIYGDRTVYNEVKGSTYFKKILAGTAITDKYALLRKMIAVGPRFYKTSVLKACGGWQIGDWGDGRLYEDVDVLLRVLEISKIANIGYTGYNIRKHDCNITRLNRKKWWCTMKNLITYYIDRWGNEVSVVIDNKSNKVHFIKPGS